MARWQLYTGLRVSELLRLTVGEDRLREAPQVSAYMPSYQVIDVIRKGRKSGYVLAPESLLEETAGYIAQHLGHRDRAITDAGYVGSDYALQRDIEAEVLEQSVAAWEHMLSTPELGGQAGAEILARRPRFRGAAMKHEIKSYARLLVDAGLTLGVCDWGYCVYRQQHYCAYREAHALLERREHEVAELRRRLDMKPVALHR